MGYRTGQEKTTQKKKIVQLSNAHNLYRGDRHGRCNKTRKKKEKETSTTCNQRGMRRENEHRGSVSQGFRAVF